MMLKICFTNGESVQAPAITFRKRKVNGKSKWFLLYLNQAHKLVVHKVSTISTITAVP